MIPPGYFESAFKIWADRAVRIAAGKPAKKPPTVQWSEFRRNHSGKWHTYSEMAKIMGTSLSAAHMQVKSNLKFYRKKTGGDGKVRVRVLELFELSERRK